MCLWADSPLMCGSLQFKNIEVPALLVLHGPRDPRGDVVKGDGAYHTAGQLLKACTGTWFGDRVNRLYRNCRSEGSCFIPAVCRIY